MCTSMSCTKMALTFFYECVTHLKGAFGKGQQNGACFLSNFLVCNIAYFNTVLMNRQEFLHRVFMFTKSKSTNALLHILSIIPVKVFWLNVPFKQTINISRGVFVFFFIWCVFHCVCLFHVLSSKHKRRLTAYFKFVTNQTIETVFNCSWFPLK